MQAGSNYYSSCSIKRMGGDSLFQERMIYSGIIYHRRIDYSRVEHPGGGGGGVILLGDKFLDPSSFYTALRVAMIIRGYYNQLIAIKYRD